MFTKTTKQSSYLDTVPLEDAKLHLRISSQDYDREVETAIASAVDWCEHCTGRTLRTAVAKTTACGRWHGLSESFPFQPVLDVVSVKYFDTDDAEQTVDPSNYRLVRSDGAAAKIELVSGFVWPTVYSRSDAIQVAYTTGYATVGDIPPRAKQAIKMMLSVYWGDLAQREIETWERQARMILGSLDWGSYR